MTEIPFRGPVTENPKVPETATTQLAVDKGVNSGLMTGGRLFMGNPKRVRSWKRRIEPRVVLRMVETVLYSTR